MKYRILDSITRLLFKWEDLRVYIFNEVDWDNSLTRTLADPESMKTAAAMWCEPDGWRGWEVRDSGTYYFHDIPEKSLSDLFSIMYKEDEVNSE
jgi:hypothetical protein